MKTMIAFLRKHTEGFLVASAIVLVGVMAGCFIWGMVYLSQNLDRAFDSHAAEAQTVNFNIAGAQKLNLKDLALP